MPGRQLCTTGLGYLFFGWGYFVFGVLSRLILLWKSRATLSLHLFWGLEGHLYQVQDWGLAPSPLPDGRLMV